MTFFRECILAVVFVAVVLGAVLLSELRVELGAGWWTNVPRERPVLIMGGNGPISPYWLCEDGVVRRTV